MGLYGLGGWEDWGRVCLDIVGLRWRVLFWSFRD